MPQSQALRTRRVLFPAVLFGLFAIMIVARLFQIQVLDHEQYAAAAHNELEGTNTVYAARGSILDRNGNLLAASVETWDLYISARAWRDGLVAARAADTISAATGLGIAEILNSVSGTGTGDVLIARDIPYEAGLELIEADVDGLIMLRNSARSYSEGDLAASILGIIGVDNSGLAGIELAYEELLRGRPGRVIYERDTAGDPIPFGLYIADEAVAGDDIVLTVDRHLQRLAEEKLDAAVAAHEASGGSIIIMDPNTGRILAFATSPRLRYSELDLEDPEKVRLLRNAGISDLYEPGSVMKVVTAAAAINSGAVEPDTTYVDTGSVQVEDREIKNWQDEVYGEQTMTGVLQRSINTGAVFMAQEVGVLAFHGYLDAFGFGKPTGVDFPGEATGLLRKPGDREWSAVDLATQSFGQGISVTPLQMVMAVAAAINGGRLLQPQFVQAIISPDGVRTEIEPVVLGTPIRPDASATIRQMMGEVVMASGYHPAEPDKYTAGGKSGTANVAVNAVYDDTQIVSFIEFAPLDNPEILVFVKLDENQDLLTGTVAAGPVAAALMDETLTYLNVAPDGRRYVDAR
jgi:stage V sporulation protein D (sporulation-specific penicillin-binding protein)